jgi:hypothetical protein
MTGTRTLGVFFLSGALLFSSQSSAEADTQAVLANANLVATAADVVETCSLVGARMSDGRIGEEADPMAVAIVGKHPACLTTGVGAGLAAAAVSLLPHRPWARTVTLVALSLRVVSVGSNLRFMSEYHIRL